MLDKPSKKYSFVITKVYGRDLHITCLNDVARELQEFGAVSWLRQALGISDVILSVSPLYDLDGVTEWLVAVHNIDRSTLPAELRKPPYPEVEREIIYDTLPVSGVLYVTLDPERDLHWMKSLAFVDRVCEHLYGKWELSFNPRYNHHDCLNYIKAALGDRGTEK